MCQHCPKESEPEQVIDELVYFCKRNVYYLRFGNSFGHGKFALKLLKLSHVQCVCFRSVQSKTLRFISDEIRRRR